MILIYFIGGISLFIGIMLLINESVKKDLAFEEYMMEAIKREENGTLTKADEKIRDRLENFILRSPG